MELQFWPSPGQHAELQLHGRGVWARSNIHLWKVRRGCSLLPLISASVWILSAKPSGRKSSVIRHVHMCALIYNTARTHTLYATRGTACGAERQFRNFVLSEFYTHDVIQPSNVCDVKMKSHPSCHSRGSIFGWVLSGVSPCWKIL